MRQDQSWEALTSTRTGPYGSFNEVNISQQQYLTTHNTSNEHYAIAHTAPDPLGILPAACYACLSEYGLHNCTGYQSQQRQYHSTSYDSHNRFVLPGGFPEDTMNNTLLPDVPCSQDHGPTWFPWSYLRCGITQLMLPLRQSTGGGQGVSPNGSVNLTTPDMNYDEGSELTTFYHGKDEADLCQVNGNPDGLMASGREHPMSCAAAVFPVLQPQNAGQIDCSKSLPSHSCSDTSDDPSRFQNNLANNSGFTQATSMLTPSTASEFSFQHTPQTSCDQESLSGNVVTAQDGSDCKQLSHTSIKPQTTVLAPKKMTPRTAKRVRAAAAAEDDPDACRRRRPFRNPTTRELTALTRDCKDCVRCRMQKIRCVPDLKNPSGECLTCKGLKRPPLSMLPCIRCIITDISLYRDQVAPNQVFSQRWKTLDLVDITEWASEEVKTIDITQMFLDAPYQVEVREFVPREGDMLEEKWTNKDVIKTHQIRPYAIANMEKTAQMLERFVDRNILKYIYGIVGLEDILLRKTYEMAYAQSRNAVENDERSLLSNTLRLWVACRKTSHPECICGLDQLGIAKVEDSTSPWFRHVPMPPIMIAQMECIVYTKLLQPLRKLVLKQLHTMVLANQPKHWFTIYLTIFCLLHSCAMITRRNAEYAKQISWPMPFTNYHAIRAHQMGALTLLAHFHYLNKGTLPFALALNPSSLEELGRKAELNAEQVAFVRDTAVWVQKRTEEMASIRENKEFGNDLYWVSQLYEKSWKPGHIV